MIQTSIKSWWLLALCGVLNAILSFIVLLILSPDAPPILHTLAHRRSTPAHMGLVALAAGACAVAAGIWNLRKARSWLLVLSGLALGALGLMMSLGASRPIAFRTIALAVAVMAVSIGVYELATARALRGRRADEWLLGAAGVLSVAFAAVFLGFVLRWIKLDPSPSAQTFHWLGSYFGFTAICMLGLALRPLGPHAAIHRMAGGALPTG